jgi:hypothetical protein
LKKHNIIIERWPGEVVPGEKRSAPCFRWTVSYHKEGLWFEQGYEDTHTAARAAAEACLKDKGIELDWLPPRNATTTLIKPRAKAAERKSR